MSRRFHLSTTTAFSSVKRYRNHLIAAVLALIAGGVWLSQTWSLSSYGLVLKAFGARDNGIVIGSPRGIISDEWGIITPLTQATVNNGFQRYNQTSFYGEDLRMLLSMPLRDWGLVFKPAKWLYPFVNAAYAFSFQSLFLLCAFVGGYALLLRRFGLPLAESVMLALVLLFTSFVQFWWGVFAGTLSLFPWVVLALGVRSPVLQIAAVGWIGAAWMLEFFYPPMFIALAIVAAPIFFALHFRRDRPLLTLIPILGAACASAIVVYYLRDYLSATLNTVFPGQRRMDGGGVPPEMFADVVWPGAHLLGFETTARYNVAEASVVGTAYILFTIAFLDYRNALTTSMDARTRRISVALLAAFAVLTAWQVLPIRADWVWWTGMSWVPPRRTVFASGLLLVMIAALITRSYGFVFSLRRYLVLCTIVLFGWGVGKADAHASWLWRVWPDLLIIPLGAVTLIPYAAIQRRKMLVATTCSAVFGLLAFGWFNPLQKAWPIFNRELTPLSVQLDYRQAGSPSHVIVSDQFGATLNGWGYRSVTHVLVAPKLDVWRRYFSDLDPATFNTIFNRYAVIQLIDEAAPKVLPNGAIGIPRSRFAEFDHTDSALEGSARLEPLRGNAAYESRNGHLDIRRDGDERVELSGWAPWKGMRAEQVLTVLSDVDAKIVQFRRVPRLDVVKVHNDRALEFSGFTVELSVPRGSSTTKPRICLVAQENVDAPRALIVDDTGGCGQ